MVSSVQCSVCSMKCTGAGSGAGVHAGDVCKAPCAVCSLLLAVVEDSPVEISGLCR